MVSPVIGITCCFNEKTGRIWLTKYYIEAVAAAGGVPVVLPVLAPVSKIKELLSICHGLLLPGGGDIDPLQFGEEPHPNNGEICPQCDYFELQAAVKALELEMPILGICRGAQVLNVAAGGTVCQDIAHEIEKPIKHFQQAPRWHPTHTIIIEPNSKLKGIIGSRVVKVNSFHHQMVGKLGGNFKVSAQAPDGVIEAIEDNGTDKFVLGVQYHPEAMWRNDKYSQNLFKALVNAAKNFNVKQSCINNKSTV